MGGCKRTRNDQRTGGQRGVNSSSTRQGSSSVRPSMAQYGLSNLRSNQRSNPQNLSHPQIPTDTFKVNTDQSAQPKASEQRKNVVEEVVADLWEKYEVQLKNKGWKDIPKYKKYVRNHLLELAENNPRGKTEMDAIGKAILDSLITYDKLNDEEKKGVVSYVGASFDNINAYERSKDSKGVEAKQSNSQNTRRSRSTGQENTLSAGMEGVCANAPQTVSDIIVYRGFKSAVINGKLTNTSNVSSKVAKSWEKKSLKENAYLSTSANRPTAVGHCRFGGSLLELSVPKGEKATYVTLRHEMREQSGRLLKLFQKGELAKLRIGEQKIIEAAVLSYNIPGFDRIVRQQSAEEIFRFVNNTLSLVVPCVLYQEGEINEYVDAGLLAFFLHSPESALRCAVSVCEALDQAGVGEAYSIGLAYGDVMIGVVGHEERFGTLTISETTGLVEFLQELAVRCRARILITGNLKRQIPAFDKNYHSRYLGDIYLKAAKRTEELYDVYDGDAGTDKNGKRKTRLLFEKGVELYKNKDFHEARLHFVEVLKADRLDGAAKEYLYLCNGFLEKQKPEKDAWPYLDVY